MDEIVTISPHGCDWVQDGHEEESWTPDPPWMTAAYTAVFTVLTYLTGMTVARILLSF
ncbi:hypothetical protein [Streptomyces sp. 5-10]|uniref:hypothetical protein n=1 Tax=Streptomyces sp. 5-10 TaxID=878925 RepID=UPI00168BB440|nr:hypothetical protein [Streptomyces sp. 5-10]MBD3004820.1 hypothetical protein [Streptomyces sp. 5-10]